MLTIIHWRAVRIPILLTIYLCECRWITFRPPAIIHSVCHEQATTRVSCHPMELSDWTILMFLCMPSSSSNSSNNNNDHISVYKSLQPDPPDPTRFGQNSTFSKSFKFSGEKLKKKKPSKMLFNLEFVVSDMNAIKKWINTFDCDECLLIWLCFAVCIYSFFSFFVMFDLKTENRRSAYVKWNKRCTMHVALVKINCKRNE